MSEQAFDLLEGVPLGKRFRLIAREEPRTWDTPNAARETDPVLDRMEKAGDMIAQGLVTLLWVVVPAVVIAQVGFKFGWW